MQGTKNQNIKKDKKQEQPKNQTVTSPFWEQDTAFCCAKLRSSSYLKAWKMT